MFLLEDGGRILGIITQKSKL